MKLLTDALKKINNFLKDEKTHAEYSKHEDFGTLMIKIVNDETNEVILEVPEDDVTVEKVCQIMNQNPKWADGIVLNSAGYQGIYYFKD